MASFRALLISAVVLVGSLAEDTPIYCRLLQVGLDAVQFQPALEDVKISTVVHTPVIGSINVTAGRMEVGAVKLVKCTASVDAKGRFNLGIQQMDLDLHQFVWKYQRQAWPHVADNGKGHANASISFNVTVDTNQDTRELFNLDLLEIKLSLGAKHHPIVTSVVEKLTHMMRPIVSEVVKLGAKHALDQSLSTIHQHGGCAFVGDLLSVVDMTKIEFTSLEPFRTRVPIFGDIDVSVNSTYIKQPTSMDCQKAEFHGTDLTTHIENVPFRMGFTWSYRKVGSEFWHNQGTGDADIVGGTDLHIDLLKPTDTSIKVFLPVLKLNLNADAHAWMYKALTAALTPLVRHGIELFGGRVMVHYVEKCLEDPKCPRVSQLLQKAPAVDDVLVVV